MIEFICGITVATIGWNIMFFLLRTREWQKRRSLERRVNDLWKHLSCGGGILGCTGGPNCTWDHK